MRQVHKHGIVRTGAGHAAHHLLVVVVRVVGHHGAAVQVGRQHEGDGARPLYHGERFRLLNSIELDTKMLNY